MIKDILNDKRKNFENFMKVTGYQKEREIAISNEHKREIEIFEKVLSYKK